MKLWYDFTRTTGAAGGMFPVTLHRERVDHGENLVPTELSEGETVFVTSTGATEYRRPGERATSLRFQIAVVVDGAFLEAARRGNEALAEFLIAPIRAVIDRDIDLRAVSEARQSR